MKTGALKDIITKYEGKQIWYKLTGSTWVLRILTYTAASHWGTFTISWLCLWVAGMFTALSNLALTL